MASTNSFVLASMIAARSCGWSALYTSSVIREGAKEWLDSRHGSLRLEDYRMGDDWIKKIVEEKRKSRKVATATRLADEERRRVIE